MLNDIYKQELKNYDSTYSMIDVYVLLYEENVNYLLTVLYFSYLYLQSSYVI